MKTCEAYKVIRYSSFFNFVEMYSYLTNVLSPIYELKYKIGKRTVPQIGEIFVFKDEQSARDFSHNKSINTRILKGIAENPKARKTVCVTNEFNMRLMLECELRNGNKKVKSLSFVYKTMDELFDLYWKCIKNKKKQIIPYWLAPKGTLVCEAFTPTEILK